MTKITLRFDNLSLSEVSVECKSEQRARHIAREFVNAVCYTRHFHWLESYLPPKASEWPLVRNGVEVAAPKENQ